MAFITKSVFQKLRILFLLGVVIATIDIVFIEAVFRFQANLDLANNIKVLVVFIEQKNVKIEITIVNSETDLDNIGSAYSVLKFVICCVVFFSKKLVIFLSGQYWTIMVIIVGL